MYAPVEMFFLSVLSWAVGTYLEGHGDLASRLMNRIAMVAIWL